jgi:hypothetical protein
VERNSVAYSANSVNRSAQYATLLRPTIYERWHGCTDLPDGQISDLAVQPPLQKYSASRVGQIISIAPPVSPDERGGSRVVTNARWDAVDAKVATDERDSSGR